MSFVKDETTARLDDLHREGMEAVGLYEDLQEHIEDSDLSNLLAAHAGAQQKLLQQAADWRRARGEMPHASDPERSHLEAAGAFVRAIFLPGRTSDHYVESILEPAGRVERLLDDVLALELAAELRAVLEAFRTDNAEFQAELRRRL